MCECARENDNEGGREGGQGEGVEGGNDRLTQLSLHNRHILMFNVHTRAHKRTRMLTHHDCWWRGLLLVGCWEVASRSFKRVSG